ncbi:GntR family transcriptional regulator [Streptomyces sp. PTM05]|uniref:GntR family transcriptional regulator n=1 Tax=Streptantibioticus parmotrematis TaxID=2873249 RepID=A0ABS7QYP5_9ACTN|nr:GntR family transcriptional regulator [Streptantibioticus parmotrematis]MBY8886907.1 GntR family transcriptional regulator [Streptantibioticus parmotrematis]
MLEQPSDARYMQLARLLSDRIMSGEWPPGTRIPTEAEMLKEYGISKTTIRAALNELSHQGLVQGVQGRGTFVRDWAGAREAATVSRAVHRRGKHLVLTDDLRQVGEPVVSRVGISGDAAAYLGRDPERGEGGMAVDRTLTDPAGGVLLHRLTLPGDLVETAPAVLDSPAAPVEQIYDMLSAAGLSLGWTEYVTARPSLPSELSALSMPEHGPILITHRVTHADDQPLIHEQLSASAARTHLAFPITATRAPARPK